MERINTNEYELRLREACLADEDTVLHGLKSFRTGLYYPQVEDRSRLYGPNALAGARGPGAFRRTGRSLALGGALFLLAAALAAGLAGLAPWLLAVPAAAAALPVLVWVRRPAPVPAWTVVVREGTETRVRLTEVVPGDIVVLGAGALIPADLRLLSAQDFYVCQTALTGVPAPVEKSARAEAPGPGIFDLKNACFQGSTVVSGEARGVVVSTGPRTFLAQLPRPVFP